MSTREDFVVTDAEVQRVVLRYRTAIVFTGRMVDPSGKRVMSGSVLLTVPDTRRFTGRCPQSIGTTVWAAHFDPQGRFDIRGVPPGIEVVVPGWWMHGPARFRIPEKSGDVGEIRLEY